MEESANTATMSQFPNSKARTAIITGFITCMILATQTASAAPVITLDQAINIAQKNNLDWKIAQARLQQAQEISRKVWANYLPHIEASGTYTRLDEEVTQPTPSGFLIRDTGEVPVQNGPEYDPNLPVSEENLPGQPSAYVAVPTIDEVVVGKQNQWGATVQLTQAILVPSLWTAIQSAYLKQEAAQLNTENVRQEILFGVAQQYYGVVSLKQFIEVQQRLLENNLAHEKDARIRVEAGASPRIALVRAQIDRARAEQDLLRAQNNYSSAKIALGTLLNRDEDFEVTRPPEPSLPKDSDQLTKKVWEQREDVRAIGVAVEAANKDYHGAYLKYLPSLVGVINYQVSDTKGLNDQYDSWALTLSLNWTIWDGGLRESDVRETRAKKIETENDFLRAKSQALGEVKRANLDWESARANRVKAEEQLKLARENSRLVEVSFQAGVATYIEVSDANTALTSAETNYVSETLNAQLALLKLLKAAGEFDPPQNPADPS